MLQYHLLDKFQWNFNQNTTIFIQENGLENVICKMVANLYQSQCVELVPKIGPISFVARLEIDIWTTDADENKAIG